MLKLKQNLSYSVVSFQVFARCHITWRKFYFAINSTKPEFAIESPRFALYVIYFYIEILRVVFNV